MSADPAFPIRRVVPLLRKAVEPFPKAAMFQLKLDGFGAVWQQLAACVVSIRTLDEVSGPAARRLFGRAPTPADVLALDAAELAALIRPAMYAETKAATIRLIAGAARAEPSGDLPADPARLMELKGVGPKCANLACGVAAGLPAISVDTHVHRITNRWGYIAAKTPEQTLAALERVLPEEFRVEINALLVPFGKHVCTPARPKCEGCAVRRYCARVGVGESR